MRWNEADWTCKSRPKLVEVITAGFYKIFFLFLRSLLSFHGQCWRAGPTASPWWWRCLCAWLGMIFMRASSTFPPNSRTVQAFVCWECCEPPARSYPLSSDRPPSCANDHLHGHSEGYWRNGHDSTLCCGLLLLHTAACPGNRPWRGYWVICWTASWKKKNSNSKMLPWVIL